MLKRFRIVPVLAVALLSHAPFILPSHARIVKESSRMNPLNVNLHPGPEYGSEARKYQGIPTLERAPGGRLWAAWYAGKVHEDHYNYVVAVTSGDDGRTWSDLKFVIDPDGDGPLRASDPCLWLDPDGRLWLFWWMNGGGKNQFNAMTTDNPDAENPTWSKPRMIAPGVMINKPIVASDGTWLLISALWHQEKSCRVMASTDHGKTWTLRGAAGVPDPNDRNCDEPMMIQRQDGSLWMLVRTAYGIGETVSHDLGKTWTPVKPSSIPHPVSRFFLRRLMSGNVLLVKHGPMDKRTGRSHLTAYVSPDDGVTWRGGLLLDERNGVSYPDGTQSPDGVIRVIYDWNRADDKHILMAAFLEADVLAGKDVSGTVRLRELVNRATGINPKPWLKDGRFLHLKKNHDGVPLLDGPTAKLDPVAGAVHHAKIGERIFSDRGYLFHDQLPMDLRGKSFIYSSIDTTEATCTQAGAVYVLTPAPERNRDSQAEALLRQGFVKVAVPEFVLFLDHNGRSHSGNVVTVFQKRLQQGDTLRLGKWIVLMF